MSLSTSTLLLNYNSGAMTEAELRHLVNGFRELSLRHEEWTHTAHIAVASALVLECGPDATEHIRLGIQRLNSHFGIPQTPTGGYHETLTIAWTRLISSRLAGCGAENAWHEKINRCVDEFADKSAILRHYSRQRIMSVEARYGWVEPDLQPLPALAGAAAIDTERPR